MRRQHLQKLHISRLESIGPIIVAMLAKNFKTRLDTMRGERVTKRKKYSDGGGNRSPTPPASRGGSGGAPDHSAIQRDDEMSSISRS